MLVICKYKLFPEHFFVNILQAQQGLLRDTPDVRNIFNLSVSEMSVSLLHKRSYLCIFSIESGELEVKTDDTVRRK